MSSPTRRSLLTTGIGGAVAIAGCLGAESEPGSENPWSDAADEFEYWGDPFTLDEAALEDHVAALSAHDSFEVMHTYEMTATEADVGIDTARSEAVGTFENGERATCLGTRVREKDGTPIERQETWMSPERAGPDDLHPIYSVYDREPTEEGRSGPRSEPLQHFWSEEGGYGTPAVSPSDVRKGHLRLVAGPNQEFVRDGKSAANGYATVDLELAADERIDEHPRWFSRSIDWHKPRHRYRHERVTDYDVRLRVDGDRLIHEMDAEVEVTGVGGGVTEYSFGTEFESFGEATVDEPEWAGEHW